MINIGMSVATGGLSKGLSAASSSLGSFRSGVTSSVGSIVSGFGQIGLAIQGVKLLSDGLISAVSGPLKLAADAEQTAVAFKVMLGSAESADKMLSQLRDFAASTPFEFPEITDSAKKLLAFGIDAEEITPTLRRLGDVSAGLGIPMSELSDIYGKARVQGRLFMEDINQLAGRGIPIQAQLAQQLGVSGEEIRGLVEDGKINFSHLEQAFKDLTGEGGQFSGLMQAQSQTLGGLWSTLQDNFNLALTEIGTAISETFDLKGAAAGVSGLIEWVMPMIRSFLAQFKEAFDAVKPIFVQLWNVAVARWNMIVEQVRWAVDSISGMFTGSMIPSFEQVRDFILDALIMVEFGLVRWKDFTALAVKSVILGFVTFGEQVKHIFTQVIPTYFTWVAQNWKSILHDLVFGQAIVMRNLVTNAIAVFSNLPGLIKGTTKWEDIWTPLTDGFMTDLSTLPDMPPRILSETEKRMREEIKGLAGGLSEDFARFREDRLKGLLPAEVQKEIAKAEEQAKKVIDEINKTVPEAVKDTVETKANKIQFAGLAEFGSKEARDSIIRHRFGGSNDPMRQLDKTSKQQLAAQQQGNQLLKKIADKPVEEIFAL